MPLSKIKTLLIDIDDTLLPEFDIAKPIWSEVCSEAAQVTGLSADAISDTLKTVSQRVVDLSPFADAARENHYDGPELLWDTWDFDGPPIKGMNAWLPEFRSQVWSEAMASLGITNNAHVSDFAHKMMELGEARRVPYTDALPVMRYLAERYSLVAATNGVPGVQARKVKSHGFSEFFDHVVLCNEFGQKPDPAPFNEAMRLANAKSDECAMIGNSLSRDIKGARGVGIYSVWVNRNGSAAAGENQPDAEVQSLSQLKDIF